MMIYAKSRRAILPLLAALAGFGLLPAAAQTAAPAASAPAIVPGKPVMEQAALDLLKQMCDKLAATQTFSVLVRDVRQVPTTAGQMIDIIGEFDVQVARPDKVRMEGSFGAVETLVAYDGAKLVVLDKPKNLYVEETVSGDLQTALNKMEQQHGLEFGVTDFLAKDPYPVFSKDLTNAYVVGDAMLNGVLTKQAVFATPTTEFQLWIDPATSLPTLLSVTYLDTQPRPTHLAIEFDDWQLGTAAADFKFTPPAGSAPIQFLKAQ